MKNKKIEHNIIEKTDYVMPIFFLILNTGFFIILSYLAGITLYVETQNKLVTIGILGLIWCVWIWGIMKNKIWRPEKLIIVEHIIVEGKK